MPTLNVSVLVDDQHRSRLPEVADALTAAGMTVDGTLGAVGIITGSQDESQVDALRRVPGVADVRPQRTVRLAPPSSRLQ